MVAALVGERAHPTQPAPGLKQPQRFALVLASSRRRADSVNPFGSWSGSLTLGHCLVKRDIE
jgi:hypothetical protein